MLLIATLSISYSVLPLFSLSAEGTEGATTDQSTEEVVTTNVNESPAPLEEQGSNEVTAGNASEPNASDVGEDTVIETGDAVAGADVVNEVNTNTISSENSGQDGTTNEGDGDAGGSEEAVNATSTTPAAQDQNDPSLNTDFIENNATSTPHLSDNMQDPNASTLDVSDGDMAATNTAPLIITSDNTNEAAVSNAVETGAGTGSNEASNNGGNVVIDTGDAYASANVANIVNSNFIGAEGFFNILTVFGAMFGDIEMEYGSSALCSTFGCDISVLDLLNRNSALVENTVEANAVTGENTASNNGGDVTIATGDAYAAANVVNFVNTNVVSAHFLSFILNAFGPWVGDLVLPPASSFEEEGSLGCPNCFGEVSVANDNTVDIENGVAAGADTGSNSANGGDGDGGTITTGNAVAEANVMTVANMNIFGNNSILIFIRTQGRWSGNIFSLPPGVEVIKTDSGFILDGMGIFSNASTVLGNASVALNAANENSATIVNQVSANASTGSNTANANGGETSITTGNAYAAANVINFANINVVSRNWLLAIVNVFGDWNGDLAFGRPDLWIGESATPSSVPLEAGSTIVYTFTYRNNGNAAATGVSITDVFGPHLTFLDSGGGNTGVAGQISWDIGTVEPGEYGTVSYTMQVPTPSNVPEGQNRWVTNTVSITAFEDDVSTADNTDSLTFNVYERNYDVSKTHYYPDLKIEKRRIGGGIVLPGDKVDYVVAIYNQGIGSAYDVVVEDIMKDPNGGVVSEQMWDLGEVFPDERITLDYTIELASNAPYGTYINIAQAKGLMPYGGAMLPYYSGYGTQELEVGGVGGGETVEFVPPPESVQQDSETVLALDEASVGETPVPIVAAVVAGADGGGENPEGNGFEKVFFDHVNVAQVHSYPEYIIEKKHKGLAMAAVPFLFESAWSALAALLALLFALFLYWLMRQREIRK